MVQIHLADDGAHPRDGQLDDGPDEVGDFVDGLDGVRDLPVDDRVNVNGHVVARDDGLRREVYVLLAQVYGSHAAAHVRPVDGARPVEKRHDDVEAAVGDAVEAAEPFDEHHGRLRDDLDGLGGDGQQDDAEDDEEKGNEIFHDASAS